MSHYVSPRECTTNRNSSTAINPNKSKKFRVVEMTDMNAVLAKEITMLPTRKKSSKSNCC